MHLVGTVLIFALTIYWCIIVLEVLISWLIIFEVINVRNDKAQNLLRLLKKMTEPVYTKIRKYIPPIAGIDITPLIVLMGIWVLQSFIARIFLYGYGYGYYF